MTRTHPLRRPLAVLCLLVPALAGLPLGLLFGAAGTNTPARGGAPGPVAALPAAGPARQVGSAVDAKVGEDPEEEEEDRDRPDERDDWFYARRTAGDPDFTVAQAAAGRAVAAEAVIAMRSGQSPGSRLQDVQAFAGAWEAVGPDPIRQAWGERILAMSGRIGALAVRSSPPYTIYLGGAQGGIWISSTQTSEWVPRTQQLPSLAIGAIALAPSDEDVVYVGTGEGALSGDSYYGNGILKSTDGGETFAHVGGDAFNQVSIARVAVDPADPEHLYVATLRGRGGARRVTPPNPTPYGIWESSDGGATWAPRLTTTNVANGGTDIVIDPLDPKVLYASFLAQNIVKSTDGGQTWRPIMTGFPVTATFQTGTRFPLAIAHTSKDVSATLYTGFRWTDTEGDAHAATVWKSTDAGGTWRETNPDVVRGYCGGQCSYDNVIGVDPTDPGIVYALGQYNYGTSSGGVYRSMDGGAHWVDIGYAQHPDYHAIAIRRDAPENIVIGNDGGVWRSSTRGGRLAPTDPITRNAWVNLNGRVDVESGAVLGSFGLQIAQFSSIAQHPSRADRIYGGTQDNGSLIKEDATHAWADKAGGDGGQMLVDPSDPRLVYSTEFGNNLFRHDDGMLGGFGRKVEVTHGITTSDRSEFYIPWLFDPDDSRRLYMGTYRVYRTDDHADHWQVISPDLTSGCGGAAPNGGRACVISALGATGGGPALYTGSEEGWIFVTPDATVDKPAWTRVDKPPLPPRPVQSFAVDRSDYRVAYVAFGGFSAATPTLPGHVFKTTDGGQTWSDIGANLVDVPVNSIVLDASDPRTLYAGTDVGPMVTRDGGQAWAPLGTGIPVVTVHQLDLNPYTRQIAVGTHGLGAWRLQDAGTRLPALIVRADAPDLPIGPGSLLTYTLKLRNVGNAEATGALLRDPLPADTSLVSQSPGGTFGGGELAWRNLRVPISGTLTVSFTVRIATTPGVRTGTVITNDGLAASAAEGVAANGSPLRVTLAPAYALALTPARQLDGTRSGQAIDYRLTVENRGYNRDAFDLTTSGNQWPTRAWDPDAAAPLPRTRRLLPGERQTFALRVSVPATAANGATDEATLTAASTGDPSVRVAARVKTIAVTEDILLVDQDGQGPDVRAYYIDAITRTGRTANVWDLATDPVLPPRYQRAHRVIVWLTGNTTSPLGPYAGDLAGFLDAGGRLFLCGWDAFDGGAGNTDFVRDYLHVDWDNERDNDIPTTHVTAVATNTVTAGLGRLPVDTAVLGGAQFSDELELLPPAQPAFRDDRGRPDALTVEDGRYRVVYLAFPFEGLGTQADRAELMRRVLDWLGQPGSWSLYLPRALNESAAALQPPVVLELPSLLRPAEARLTEAIAPPARPLQRKRSMILAR